MHELAPSTLFDLSEKRVLITGGSGHLGSAMTKTLAAAGATVVVGSRERRRAESVAEELRAEFGGMHFGVELDQLDEHSVQAGFAHAVESAGGIEVLVNNGQQGHAMDLTDVTAEAFRSDLNNATGYFLLARHFRNHVVERQVPGSIVMVGSMYGVVGSYPDAYEDVCVASPVQYHTLKGGIVHMTRHLSVYWARDNIRVNSLSPGPIGTERIFERSGSEEAAQQESGSLTLMGRVGLPMEIANAALFLASDESSFMTGDDLLVDGGYNAL